MLLSHYLFLASCFTERAESITLALLWTELILNSAFLFELLLEQAFVFCSQSSRTCWNVFYQWLIKGVLWADLNMPIKNHPTSHIITIIIKS